MMPITWLNVPTRVFVIGKVEDAYVRKDSLELLVKDVGTLLISIIDLYHFSIQFTRSSTSVVQCTESCNGAGECLSLKQLSQKYAVGAEPFYETIWDAEMIYGCSCRRGYHGYDCSKCE
jgi:hypothetical protein